MSELRKRWVLFRHPHANIVFQGPVYLGPGFSLHVPDRASFIVGPGVEFRRNFRAELGPGARIEIGAGTACTYDVLMQCLTEIEIGKRCLLGQATAIFDGSHRFREVDKPVLGQGYDLRPITIGDDAAVMTKCTVINDIGTRAFVGANSVVSKPVPPFTVAVGAPARPIDYFGPEGQEPAELVSSSSDGSG
jgi:acetyltransferase-like isoleucine patch superfamily enzyme